MATTTNYAFDLPVVGGNQDTWGGLLNGNWSALDTLLGGITATEFSYLDGATSNIQAQLNDITTTPTFATSVTLTGAVSNWQFALSGNDLIISYGGVKKAKLDTSGNLTVTGNITAYGTV